MARRDRVRRPARRAAYITPKPRMLVVTEGKATEPEYLKGFVRDCHNPRVEIEVHDGVGVPKTLVEFAKQKKKSAWWQAQREKDANLAYDEVWCVFDIDQHPNVSNAKQMAKDSQIELAISNPCIELWLWLHFADAPGCIDRHVLQKSMKKHIQQYDKHVNYADYKAGYESAAARAKALDHLADSVGDLGRNPTTGMWRLTESIRSGL